MAETTSRRTLLEKALAVLTALLTLGAAYLGYMSASLSNARDQAEEAAADTDNDLSSLQGKYDALRTENARLREQLGLPGPPPDPGTSATEARVRRSGQLTLATSRSGDLDSPSSDPQWDDGQADIYYSGSAIVTYTSFVDLLYLGSKEADYDTCRNTTGYSDESIGAEDGAYICVKTSDNRYSAVRMTQPDSSKITLDIVTYDPPDA